MATFIPVIINYFFCSFLCYLVSLNPMKNNKFQINNVLSISFGHFIHDTYTAFLAPLLPLLIEKLQITYAIAGLLSAILRAPSMLNPFVGLIADKISLRYFIILGPAITSIAMSLLGVAPNLSSVIVLLLITGISSTIFHVPSPVMIKNLRQQDWTWHEFLYAWR